ncbi:exodeoxyribonuclease III [Anaplasma phagocytophilum str. MRK]|uniref:exodeoxyribonuclease III n=1 Tax=Anaplasma phagocytophilum TaxID=948 RepID=UPI000533A479|nr:exodeoxyribonuclease III [Anaplasma phagocytophilum]KDB55892.1 exodeoxyribonuclease III [Anaplasma phagocytophilum str. MRK]
MIRVITWNVNSIRKRIEHLCSVLSEHSIDVAMLQEIKCTNEQFPFVELEALGYKCYVHGQKSRNGVAIISKLPVVEVVSYSVLDEGKELESAGSYSSEESRYIECTLECTGNKKIRVVSVYVPNGQEIESETFFYKLKFLEHLKDRLLNIMKTEDFLIAGGDFNVAPEEIDVHDPKALDGRLCFHILERAKFREILNNGIVDIFRTFVGIDRKEFSWWNYREGGWQNNRGLRIDALLSSPQIADKVLDCSILSKVRGWNTPSDHAPVMGDIDV